MNQSVRRSALFEGLVYNEEGDLAEVSFVGSEAQYVVLEAGFRRHVPAEYVDLQVIEWFQEQVAANRDFVAQGTMEMLGKDDLFTKAMIESSINNMSELVDFGLPEDARIWLGMLGFRVVINLHGDLVDIVMPNPEPPDE